MIDLDSDPAAGRAGPAAGHAADDPRWRGLYLAGGVAALLTAACLPLQIVFFIAWPPPLDGTVLDWFGLYLADPVRGLLSLDLVMMIEQVLLIAIVLALYALLHRRSESTMALALVGSIVAATLLLSSNTAFEMLSLSRGYGAATGEVARAQLLAAGQTALATYWDKGSAFVYGYVVASIAGMLIGVAMLRDRALGRAAAWAAIVGNAIGLGLFLPGIGIGVSLVSVGFLCAWDLLIGVRLVRLGRARPARAAMPDRIGRPAIA